MSYVVDGEEVLIKAEGLLVTIIDFTLSRMEKVRLLVDNCVCVRSRVCVCVGGCGCGHVSSRCFARALYLFVCLQDELHLLFCKSVESDS